MAVSRGWSRGVGVCEGFVFVRIHFAAAVVCAFWPVVGMSVGTGVPVVVACGETRSVE